MAHFKYIRALIVAGALCLSPLLAVAETLQIIRGDASAPIRLSQGMAINVNSPFPFIEFSISNPRFADVAAISDQQILLTGISAGRATLTVFHDDNSVSNIEVLVVTDKQTSTFAESVQVPKMPLAEQFAVVNGVATQDVPVPQGGAVVIKTDLPFAEFNTADEDISDSAALASDLLYVLGKRGGETTLTFARADGGPTTVIQIVVTPNMDGME